MSQKKKVLVVLFAVMVLLASTVGLVGAFDVEPQAFTYLSTSGVTLEALGSGNLRLKGFTTASMNVSKIEVHLTLQRYNGSSWDNLGTYSNTEYNASRVDHSLVATVPTGYYYRLRGYHVVYNGITESTVSYTSATLAY